MAQGNKADIKSLHEALFSYISDAVFIYQRPDGMNPSNFIDVNDAACQMLDFTKNELLGLSHKDLSDLNYKDVIKYSDEHHVLFESVLRTKNNCYIPVEINSHVFLLDETTTVIAAIRDISERKKAEETLQEREQWYHALFDNANDGIAVYQRNKNGKASAFLDANDHACKMFGYTKKELLKLKPADLVPPGTKAIWGGGKNKQSEGKQSVFETERMRKDGITIPLEISSHVFSINGITTVLIHFRDISKRKSVAQTLEENEEKYRALFNNTNEAVYVSLRSPTTQTRVFLDVNDVACQMTGYSKEELLQMGPRDIADPNHDPDYNALGKKLFEEGHARFETNHVTKTGIKISVEVSAHLFDFKGRPTAVSFVRDITERKKAEEEKKGQEEQYRALFNNINEAVYVTRRTATREARNFVDVNDVACHMMGYTRQEFLKMGPADLAAPESKHDHANLMKQLHEEKHVIFESVHVAKDGSKIPVELSIHMFDFREATTSVSIVKDITERKKIEQERKQSREELELRVSEGTKEWQQANAQLKSEIAERKQAEKEILRLNSAMEQASDGIAIADTDGIILYTNHAHAKMHGYSQEELLGTHLGSLNKKVITKKYRDTPIGTLVDDDTISAIEVEHGRKDGSAFPALVSVSYLSDENGEKTGMVTIVRDITERKLVENELLRLNSAVQQASDGIIIFNITDKKILYANNAFAQIMGYGPHELMGLFFPRLIKKLLSDKYNTLSDVLTYDTLTEIKEAGDSSTRTVEIEHIRKDNSVFPALLSFAYLENEGDLTSDLVVVIKDITERKNAEAEIRRLNSAMEQASDGIAIFSKGTRVISYINAAYADMLGYSPDELIGTGFRHLNNRLISSQFETLADVLEVTTGAIQTLEMEHIRKDGSLFPMLGSFTFIKNTDGEITEVVVQAKDITERKRAEAEIRRLNSAMQQASDGIVMFNKETGQISYMNGSYEQMLGYEPQELLNTHIRHLMNRTVDDKYPSLSDVLDDEKPAEQNVPVEHIRKDGSVFPAIMSLAYILDDNSKRTGDVLIVTRDVTESKKAESEILLLNSAMQQASDGIAIFNRSDKKISYVNNAYTRMLGYSEWELIGVEFRHVLNKLVNNEYSSLSEMLNENERIPITSEVEHVRKDGSLFPAVLSTAYITNKDGETTDTIVVVASDITDRKDAEKEIVQLNSAMEQASDGIAIFSRTDGAITYVNNAFAEALGYTKKEIVGLHIRQTLERVTSEEFENLGALLDLYMTTTQTLEVEHFRKDGSIYPALLSIAYIKDENGNNTPSVIVISKDVTEAKQAEKAIKKSEEKYRASFDKARDAINVFTPDKTFVDANQRFLELCGYSKKELLKLHLLDVYPEASSKESQQRVKAAAQGKEVPVFEVDLIRKDGSAVPVEIAFSAIKNAYGHDIVFQGNIRDITERKQMEMQLKHNYDLQNVLNSLLSLSLSDVSLDTLLKKTIDMLLKISWFASESSASIFLADDQDNLIMKAHKGLAAQIQKQCKTVPFGKCICGKAASTKKVVFTDCVDQSHEIVFDGIKPHGHYCVPILSFGKTLGVINMYTAEGHSYDSKEVQFLQSVASVMAGIIVRKRAENEVRQTNAELAKANIELKEADKLKSIFLASMSHELRTPLNSIIGFTSLMQQGMTGPINKEQKSQLGMVKGSASHLLSLINDVLDLSKLEAGRVDLIVEKFNLHDLLSESLGSFAPMVEIKKIQLNSSYPTNIMINNDPRRLKQIIINMVSNAVKFTDAGSVNVFATTQNGSLVIEVKDTGMGMKDAEMRRLFQPFQQLNEQLVKSREGTGLGLYLSRKLANLMGGDISAISEFGVGSIFTVTTPIDVEK